MHKAILLLNKIPKGKVTTYKELARACETSPRAIGRILANNPYPFSYPCYKVVGSDGRLTGYSLKGGLTLKAKLLKKDGIETAKGVVRKEYFHNFK